MVCVQYRVSCEISYQLQFYGFQLSVDNDKQCLKFRSTLLRTAIEDRTPAKMISNLVSTTLP